MALWIKEKEDKNRGLGEIAVCWGLFIWAVRCRLSSFDDMIPFTRASGWGVDLLGL